MDEWVARPPSGDTAKKLWEAVTTNQSITLTPMEAAACLSPPPPLPPMPPTPYASVRNCPHGYTICAPCDFIPPSWKLPQPGLTAHFSPGVSWNAP